MDLTQIGPDARTAMNINARGPHRIRDKPARFFVKAPQDLRGAIVHRYLDAKPVQNSGKFAADIPTPDYKDGFGEAF